MPTSSEVLDAYLRKNNHVRKMKYVDFLTPLPYYVDVVERTDPVLLSFLKPNQDLKPNQEKLSQYLDDKREQLIYDLEMAQVLLIARIKYEIEHQKTENLAKYWALMKRSDAQLVALGVARSMEKQDSPIKYLGIALAKEFVDQLLGNMINRSEEKQDSSIYYLGSALESKFPDQLVDNMMNRKSKTLKDFIGGLNSQRLYWIWASVFLKTILSLIPEDFFNARQAGSAIYAPDPYTGCLSWTLYYFRFFVNLFLVFKHVIPGSWMSEAEKEVSWTERLSTQLDQRKFTLLNDSIWATANLLCYFWLTGKGALGVAGDALTIALLIFDICMVAWDFDEQRKKHDADLKQLTQDIDALSERIKILKRCKVEAEKQSEHDLHLNQLQLQLNNLQQMHAQKEVDWKLQKYHLCNNLAYAVGLTAAFIMLTTPFMPIPAALASSLGIVGAVACFVVTAINGAINGGIEIHKTRHARKGTEAQFTAQIALLNKKLHESDIDENERKFIFLEIKKLHATTDYQRQLIAYQTIDLIRSMIVDALIPAVVFSTLVFLPLGAGIGAMVGAMAFAMAVTYMIQRLAPDENMKNLPAFDQQEYDAFCNKLKDHSDSAAPEEQPKVLHRFFKDYAHKTARPELDAKNQFGAGKPAPI